MFFYNDLPYSFHQSDSVLFSENYRMEETYENNLIVKLVLVCHFFHIKFNNAWNDVSLWKSNKNILNNQSKYDHKLTNNKSIMLDIVTVFLGRRTTKQLEIKHKKNEFD